MKLKPFNLEEWLKDTSQEVYTRDGNLVKELYHFTKFCDHGDNDRFCLAGYEINTEEDEADIPAMESWRPNGRYLDFDSESSTDLMLVDKDVLDEVEEFVISQVSAMSSLKYTIPSYDYLEGYKRFGDELRKFIKSKKEKE